MPLAIGLVLRGADPTEAITRLAELGLELESPLLGGLASLLDGVVAVRPGDPERGADLARAALGQWRGQPFDVHVLNALDVDRLGFGRAVTRRPRAGCTR